MTVASSPEEGRELLRGTVERYRRNRDHYRSSAFDETSTRESFINTFFQALGWDVLDDSSRGPQRDVIFHHRLIEQRQIAGLEAWDEDLSEEEISARAPLVRIPDYAFLVGGSLRFFVEAKRPRVRLDGRGPA